MADTMMWSKNLERLIAGEIEAEIKNSAEPLIQEMLVRIEAKLRETVGVVAVKLARSVDIIHMEDRLRVEVRLPENKGE